jgi:glutaredoxin-related protein
MVLKNFTTRRAFAVLLAVVLLSSSSSPGAFAMTSKASTRSPNPIVKVMANGMKLLKPAFVAEAKVQASLLGAKVDADDVAKEIAREIQSNKIVIYTYALSPFSTEALAMLDSTGYDYSKIELGAEWFLLGGKNSVKRVALSEQVETGATSLPKVFVNGKCIGGCAELAEAVESGSLDALLVQKSINKMKLLPFL